MMHLVKQLLVAVAVRGIEDARWELRLVQRLIDEREPADTCDVAVNVLGRRAEYDMDEREQAGTIA
jgi:hypothetical protein